MTVRKRNVVKNKQDYSADKNALDCKLCYSVAAEELKTASREYPCMGLERPRKQEHPRHDQFYWFAAHLSSARSCATFNAILTNYKRKNDTLIEHHRAMSNNEYACALLCSPQTRGQLHIEG